MFFPLCIAHSIFYLYLYFDGHRKGAHLYQRGVRDVWGKCSCLRLLPGSTTVRNSQIVTTTVLNSSQPDSDKTSCLNRSSTDCLSFSYSLRKYEVSYSIHGKRAFLFYHNAWGRPVVSQHHSFVIAIDRADATRPALGKGAVLMHAALQLMVYGAAVSQKYSFVPCSIHIHE